MPEDQFGVERLRDLYRVHDAAKKQKKEQRRTDDDREFKDFLDDSEKEPEGYRDFVEEDYKPIVPTRTMLDALGAHAAAHLKIEPLEPEPAPDTATEQAEPANGGEAESETKEQD